RGYTLPDPNIIVGHSRDATRTAFFLTWLKLRTLCIYLIRSTAYEPLTPKQWRKILGLEIHRTTTATRFGQEHMNLERMLKTCLDEGGLQGSLDISNLAAAPIEWCGQKLLATMPSSPMAQEILWELFEINFRHELVALD
ncbi:hypothetical protein BDZ89DRAFT_915244, partial [Hymenopellis radicata]